MMKTSETKAYCKIMIKGVIKNTVEISTINEKKMITLFSMREINNASMSTVQLITTNNELKYDLIYISWGLLKNRKINKNIKIETKRDIDKKADMQKCNSLVSL